MAWQQFHDFEEFLEQQFSETDPNQPPRRTREELGGALISYIIEANHQGWDGFSSRDLTGIGRFLEDFSRIFTGYGGETEDFTRTIYTGGTTYPGSNRKD
jgi:hypothetical protein